MLSDDYHYIPEYYKIPASNHLAASAKHWTQLMNSMKSAIYYSQWMVFDLNKFNQREELDLDEDGFLYVLEDGFSVAPITEINKSKKLLADKYFASFNEKLDS